MCRSHALSWKERVWGDITWLVFQGAQQRRWPKSRTEQNSSAVLTGALAKVTSLKLDRSRVCLLSTFTLQQWAYIRLNWGPRAGQYEAQALRSSIKKIENADRWWKVWRTEYGSPVCQSSDAKSFHGGAEFAQNADVPSDTPNRLHRSTNFDTPEHTRFPGSPCPIPLLALSFVTGREARKPWVVESCRSPDHGTRIYLHPVCKARSISRSFLPQCLDDA